MSYPITQNMVKNFQIYEKYNQSYPSNHICKITLDDGRKTKDSFYGPEIYALIQSLAKEKISFKRDPNPRTLCWKPQNLDTFSCHEYDWKDLLKDIYLDQSSIPEAILSKRFQKITLV